jgi:hypothetical protein
VSEQNTPAPKNRRGCLINALLVCASLLVVFLVAEVTLRLYYRFIKSPNVITIDPKLGWRATPNFHAVEEKTDACGNRESIQINTGENGFRMFGNVNATRPKLLFIGDSYTFAKDVAQEKTFYTLIARELDVEVFAYGGDGFGTLQEYYILDEWLDRIQPDAVILQFCMNDFFDNSLELNYSSWMSNCRYRKPYLMPDGEIQYVNAGNLPWLRDFTMDYSKALYSILIRVNNLVETPIDKSGSAEAAIEREGASNAAFQRSVTITEEVLNRIKRRCGQVPVVAFTSDTPGLYFETWRDLADRTGILFCNEVTTDIAEAESKGECLRAEDRAHWNAAANEYCAKALALELRTIGIHDNQTSKSK